MKDYTLVLQNGTEVTLTQNDMFIIREHYERESIYEFLEENYAWDEETLQSVTGIVHYLMVYKDYTEEDAIQRCIADWNLPKETKISEEVEE